MVMERINGFPNPSKGLLERFQGSPRTEGGGGENPAAVGTPGGDQPTVPADRAEISAKAHDLMALRHAMDSGRQALEDVPEIRKDRLAEVRERLERGFYNSIEVRNRVADRLDDLSRKLENL